MSERIGTEDKIVEKKSEDKQEIEDEERKKMIGGGEEVSRSEVEKKKKALEEAAEGAARKRAPIGGIRVTGFLRVSRSRDKNKVSSTYTKTFSYMSSFEDNFIRCISNMK